MPRAGYFGNAPPKGFNWHKICQCDFFTVIPSRYFQGITELFSFLSGRYPSVTCQVSHEKKVLKNNSGISKTKK
jgi:hypothetical protein